MENNKQRFSSAPWIEPQNIMIGGAGGIGSWVALALSRIGHNLFIYDFDTVDEFNLGGQFYSHEQVYLRKVDALRNNLIKFSAQHINTFGKFLEDSEVCPITIAAFDNMEARKMLFNQWKKLETPLLFIDGRMSAEHFEVFAVTPDRADQWEKDWFPSSEANVVACSYKATTFNAMGIAYIITTAVNNFLSLHLGTDITRELPYKWTFHAGATYYETETGSIQ